MTAERFLLVPFALVLAAAGPLPASAQSFDCAKAATTVERLICADRKLGALDAELAGEIKKALAAAPAQRDELLKQERRWVRERDRACAIPIGGLTDAARARGIDCLTTAYDARIAAVRSAGADGRTAICQTLGDRYRALLERDPQAPFRKSFYADGPLDVLAAAGVGVTVAEPAAELDEFSRRKLVDWAKRQPKPFVFPENVSKELEELTHSQLRIDRLPGANYYAAGVVEGTAACYSTIYFEVERRRARLAAAPAGWEADSGSGGCGVARSFGAIDATPVAFEQWHGYTPSLASGVSVSPWSGKGFAPSCEVTFAFAPRFDAHGTYNAWDERCDGADCDALRRAALALVEEAQKNPLDAQKTAVAGLTAPQRDEFAELKKQAGADEPTPSREPSEASDPASYTDNSPLLSPLVHDGRLYLAALGHFTIGWRVFADWSVSLRRLEKGKAEDRASFAIGMTKGRLENVSVK